MDGTSPSITQFHTPVPTAITQNIFDSMFDICASIRSLFFGSWLKTYCVAFKQNRHRDVDAPDIKISCLIFKMSSLATSPPQESSPFRYLTRLPADNTR